MQDRRVVKLIELLDKKEQKKCLKWIKAEYGLNSKQEELYTSILHLVIKPPISKKVLSKEEIWMTLFPNEPYHDPRFRKLCTQLVSAVEQFISIQAFQNHPTKFHFTLMKELKARNSPLHRAVFRKLEQQIDKIPTQDHFYYEQRAKFYIELLTSENSLGNRVSQETIEKVHSNLDKWLLLQKMHQEIIRINYKNNYPNLEDSFLSQNLLPLLQKMSTSLESPVLDFYKYLYLKQQNEPVNIQSIINKLWALKGKFSSGIHQDMFGVVFNFFVRKVNTKGNKEDLQFLLELYEKGISEGYLQTEGLPDLQLTYYKNMVKIAFRINANDKADVYLQKIKELIEHIDNPSYQLLLGIKSFYQKEYKDVLKRLGILSIPDTPGELERRFFRLKSLYELGESVEIETEVHSLKEFIRTQKNLSAYFRNSWYNRIKLFERLIRIKHKGNMENLLHDIHTVEPLGNREWLLKKTREALERL